MSFEDLEERLLVKAQEDTELARQLLRIAMLDRILSPTGVIIDMRKHHQFLSSKKGQQMLLNAMDSCREVAKKVATSGEDPESIAQWLSHNVQNLVKKMAAREEMEVYYSLEPKFMIYYPAGWRVQRRQGQRLAKWQVLFDDGKGGRSFNIMINALIPGCAEIRHFKKTWESSVGFRRGKLVSSRNIMVSSVPAFEGISLMRKGFLFGGFREKVKKVAFILGGYECLITGSSSIKDYAEFEPILDRCIQSLSWAKVSPRC